MSRPNKPWYRKARDCWYVKINGQTHNLGSNREAAFRQFHELMAEPQERRVIDRESVAAVFDAFLDWCQKHRASDTYDWYRERLEKFAAKHPRLRVASIRPYHIQEWIDAMDVKSGTKRNYCRAVKRALRWAKEAGLYQNESRGRYGVAQRRQTRNRPVSAAVGRAS